MGPGSYDPIKNVDRKPVSMTIQRAGIARNVSPKLNSGSIQDSFFDNDDDGPMESPGPGAYNHINKNKPVY